MSTEHCPLSVGCVAVLKWILEFEAGIKRGTLNSGVPRLANKGVSLICNRHPLPLAEFLLRLKHICASHGNTDLLIFDIHVFNTS